MSTTLARTASSLTDSALLKKLVVKLVLGVLIVAFGFFMMVLGAYIEGESITMRHNESMAMAILTASI